MEPDCLGSLSAGAGCLWESCLVKPSLLISELGTLIVPPLCDRVLYRKTEFIYVKFSEKCLACCKIYINVF